MAGSKDAGGHNKLKLLVPFNFTRKSELALEFALTYSQNFNADVYLFHVFEDKTTNYRQLDKLNEEYASRMKQVVTMTIERMASLGVSHTVEDVHRRVSRGKPGEEILNMTVGISADMIIMGAPETQAFKKLLAIAPCTVVLVREKDPTFVL